MAKSNDTLMWGGAIVLALLLFSGSASASPTPAPDLPIDDPDQPPQPVPSPENWGSTPPALIPEFERAEQASGIPGLGRFMAVWAWGAFRAMQPLVSPEEAAAIALANPALCRNCWNTSQSEKIASARAWENVTLPKGQAGQYGTGKYDPPWPTGPYGDAWRLNGSSGLFDILAGAHAHSGIHDPGKFAPLINFSPNILMRVDVQLYIGGYLVQRIIKSPLYKVLVPGDPKETWTRIRRVTASPDGFVKNTAYSQEVGQRFQGRAQELGIDLSALAYPWPLKWPGAQAYYNALQVLKS